VEFKNTVFYSWWKLMPLFQGALHHHHGLFSAHPLSAVLQYNFIMLFTFIDLFLRVHLHHIFILMSFSIVLGQFSYIYNLGETGCYSFQVGDEFWLYISKERLNGEGKKLKPIRYGPFKIIDKIGNNAFCLDLPPYMQMYAVVNVENLKLYEPPLIYDQGDHVQIPSIDDFSPEYLTGMQEDTILDRRMQTSKRGNVK
jgi:hypothetical protein